MKRWWSSLLQNTGEVLLFLGQTFYWSKTLLKNFRFLLVQMYEVGVTSLPIVSLMAVFVGMVSALQAGVELLRFEMQDVVGVFVSASLTREVGPVLTGLIIAGRVGAAMTAELGTMKVSEEIDALRTMAINPIRYLVVPRFWASVIMLPLLTIYTYIIGIGGGLIIARYQLKVPPHIYLQSIVNYLSFKDIYSGLIKTATFGAIIAIIACYQGFRTHGGARGVGKATTYSVVVSFLLIIISNYLLTQLFFNLLK